jgi:hypothetical protein
MGWVMLRSAIVFAGLAAVAPAAAEQLKPDEARAFVVGKMFDYTCFEGTSGRGRIYPDGSVAGTIQIRGKGKSHYVVLPAGTIQVKPESVCATVKGVPFQPCFNVVKTDARSFRGSISGFGFAYCDFTRRNARFTIARSRAPKSAPVVLRPSVTASSD